MNTSPDRCTLPPEGPLKMQVSTNCTIFDTPWYKICRGMGAGTSNILKGPSGYNIHAY